MTAATTTRRQSNRFANDERCDLHSLTGFRKRALMIPTWSLSYKGRSISWVIYAHNRQHIWLYSNKCQLQTLRLDSSFRCSIFKLIFYSLTSSSCEVKTAVAYKLIDWLESIFIYINRLYLNCLNSEVFYLTQHRLNILKSYHGLFAWIQLFALY